MSDMKTHTWAVRLKGVDSGIPIKDVQPPEDGRRVGAEGSYILLDAEDIPKAMFPANAVSGFFRMEDES
jgi:hypothetical protein